MKDIVIKIDKIQSENLVTIKRIRYEYMPCPTTNGCKPVYSIDRKICKTKAEVMAFIESEI